jgi:hypothetical protein
MIRGVGPVYAKKLVSSFGEKVFDVIEATPDRLREVPAHKIESVSEIDFPSGNAVPVNFANEVSITAMK